MSDRGTRRRVLMRAMAFLLVAAFGADLGDAMCDPLPIIPGAVAIASDPGPGLEDCAAVCVADCFCCSRSETVSVAELLPESGPARALGAEIVGPLLVGVRPPLDHPPSSLL